MNRYDVALLGPTMSDAPAVTVGCTRSCIPAQECVLSFSLHAAAASDAATATVLTAASVCSKLQRLCVGTEGECGVGVRHQLSLRRIPGALAALGSLTSLELLQCGLRGPQQLPPNLIDLRLDDHADAAYTLPPNLSAMTSLARLTSNAAAAPPPVWPPRLSFLQVRCL
jgi:hypothetical protein